jgi:O-antigen ligase
MLSQPKLNNLYIYLLYGLAFLIPSGFYNFEGVIISLILVIWLLSKQFNVIPKQTISSYSLLPLFFVLYILSLIYTEDLPKGFKQITMHLSYVFIPLFLITNLIDYKIKEKILLVFFSSTVLFLLIADLYAIIDIIRTDSYIIRVGSADYYKFLSFGLTRIFSDWHPTLVSLFSIFSLVIAVKQLFKSQKRFAILIMVFIVLNIFLLKSLIGIVCLFLVFSLFLFSFIKRKSYKVIFVVFVVFLASVFYATNPFRIDKIQRFKKTKIETTDNEDRRNVLSIRLVKWSSALDIFKENVLIGVAPGDLKQELVNEYTENGFEFAAENRFGPHNQFLQILASFGIIGFFLFFLIIFLPYFKQLEINSLYGWFLLITLMFFLTEDVLERQQGVVFFSFFYVFLLQQTKKE